MSERYYVYELVPPNAEDESHHHALSYASLCLSSMHVHPNSATLATLHPKHHANPVKNVSLRTPATPAAPLSISATGISSLGNHSSTAST